MKPGPKFYEWERKGVPIRLECGAPDAKPLILFSILSIHSFHRVAYTTRLDTKGTGKNIPSPLGWLRLRPKP